MNANDFYYYEADLAKHSINNTDNSVIFFKVKNKTNFL